MQRKNYRTKRLILRPYLLKDYETWVDVYVRCGSKESKYDLSPRTLKDCSLTQFKKLIRRHINLAKDDKCYVYGIFDRKTRELLGAVDVFIICRDQYQIGNIGYRIHNRHRRMGFGKETVRQALRIAFADIGLNRVEAAINLDNKASMRLARSSGMRKEGIKRKYIFENGKWDDHVVYVANPSDLGLKAKKPIL